MNCCRKIIHRYSNSNRGVFCLQWVLPLRIVAVGSLVIHFIYKLISDSPLPYGTLLTIVHIFAALVILGECRRSVRYHNAIEELELLGERRQALLSKKKDIPEKE